MTESGACDVMVSPPVAASSVERAHAAAHMAVTARRAIRGAFIGSIEQRTRCAKLCPNENIEKMARGRITEDPSAVSRDLHTHASETDLGIFLEPVRGTSRSCAPSVTRLRRRT